MIGVSAICAETDELAEELAASADLVLLRFQQGKYGGTLPAVNEARLYPYTAFEREIVRANRARLFVGSPVTVGERLSRLAEEAGVREVMVTTMIHEHEARRRSYALLADAFALQTVAVN